MASSTDPKLYGIEYAGVELENDKGVAVFRVSPSARAPHRDTETRESYYRSGAKSEPMDMHRLQAMSVEKWQGLQRIESRLHSRGFAYEKTIVRPFKVSTGRNSFEIRNVALNVSGSRAIAVPLEALSINDIASRESLKLVDAPLKIMSAHRHEMFHQPRAIAWAPILRGIRFREEDDEWAESEERTILSDGLIEIRSSSSESFNPEDGESSRHHSAATLLRPIAQFIVMVECFRNAIGRPDLEFAISIEWRVPSEVKVMPPQLSGYSHERAMKVIEEVNRLPDLAMPLREKIPDFWTEIQREFFQSFGKIYDNVFPLNFEMAISHVMERSSAV